MIHFHSSDDRFCGTQETGRQFSPDDADVTCPACKSKDTLTLSPQGAAYVAELERTPTTQSGLLLARLQAAYPSHEFDYSDKDAMSCGTDCDNAPQMLITFTGPYQMCIVDPLTDGYGACSALAVYGISQADAQAIRAHNKVIAG